MTAPLEVRIIVGATRPQRRGAAVAGWVSAVGQQRSDMNVGVLDLAEINLPFLDEDEHPRLGRYQREHTRRWSALVDQADAFVIVTPEYNHSFPAPLKNALDYLNREWADKPAGIVSYGGISAGLRAAAALRPVLSSLRIASVGADVAIPFIEESVTEDGNLRLTIHAEHAASAMYDRLHALGVQLRNVREHG